MYRDLAHVRASVEAPGSEPFVVGVCAPRQGEELRQESLLAGVVTSFEQDLRMTGVLDVLAPVEAAPVTGDQLILIVNAEPIRIDLDGDAPAGVARRPRVAVGIEDDAELAGGAQGQNPGQIVGVHVRRLQMRALLGEQVRRSSMRLAVDAHVGDFGEPDLARGIHMRKILQFIVPPVENAS